MKYMLQGSNLTSQPKVSVRTTSIFVQRNNSGTLRSHEKVLRAHFKTWVMESFSWVFTNSESTLIRFRVSSRSDNCKLENESYYRKKYFSITKDEMKNEDSQCINMNFKPEITISRTSNLVTARPYFFQLISSNANTLQTCNMLKSRIVIMNTRQA